MDIDAANPIAGPSNTRQSPRPTSPTPQMPPLFLPPPGPPPNPVYLSSTEDLLGKFLLLDAYDKYVRPSATSAPDSAASPIDSKPLITSTLNPPTPGAHTDKGKGKEVVPSTPHAPPMTPAADPQDDDDDGPGGKKEDKKKKNSYRHLIKSVPGKHSMRKDDYLTSIMQVPPKQRVRMVQFDMRTQNEAFTMSAGGIPGYNIKTIVKETPQAREDRKKNREAKRLRAEAALQASSTTASTPAPQHPQIQTPIPTSATALSFPRSSTPAAHHSRPPTTTTVSTPRPHPSAPSSRPASTKPPLPPVHVPAPGTRVSTPLRTGTPTAPHPLSAPPLSASSLVSDGLPGSGGGGMQEKRGKKRDRDDSLPTAAVNGNVITNGRIAGTPNNAVAANNGNPPPPPKAILGAKAGTAGIRPRPLKKQRMDMQGQSRDIPPIQQPTPQGV